MAVGEDGEDVDEDRAEPEVGQRDPEEGGAGDEVVELAVLAHRADDADGDGDHQGDDVGGSHQHRGVGQADAHQMGDGVVEGDGVTEVGR